MGPIPNVGRCMSCFAAALGWGPGRFWKPLPHQALNFQKGFSFSVSSFLLINLVLTYALPRSTNNVRGIRRCFLLRLKLTFCPETAPTQGELSPSSMGKTPEDPFTPGDTFCLYAPPSLLQSCCQRRYPFLKLYPCYGLFMQSRTKCP